MSLNDPIVDEIHKFRNQHAAMFGHDVWAIVGDLIRQQEEAKVYGKQFTKSPGKRCNPGLRYTPIAEEMPTATPPTDTFPLTSDGTSAPHSP